MTVPAPRGGDTGQESTTVLGILVETTRRIEDTVARGFDNVNQQLARLPEVYVARREFDRYRDERTVEFQSAQQNHDKDIADLKEEQRERAKQAVAFRRWLIGVGSAFTVGLGGVAATVVTHFH